MDPEFLTESTWTEVAQSTRRQIFDGIETVDILFFGLTIFAGLGIIATLFSYFAPVDLISALTPIDSGIISTVFFAFFLCRFSNIRKTTLHLTPIVLEPQRTTAPEAASR